MLFNSLQFLIFFAIVYCLYLRMDHKWQNRMLLAASCVFYGCWDWRFLFLIFASVTTDYFCGLSIFNSPDDCVKKRFLLVSVVINLTILGFFKYFNFFASNLQTLLGLFGLTIHPILLHIALPIGISFYTFRTLTYTFDIYTGQMEPTKSYVDYALYVTFFPQLIAGPIMKAKDLLPQIMASRKVTGENFYRGCYLIFFGLFQKLFIADNLARIADPIFDATQPHNGISVLIAVYALAFQIYCDFAGYSNIARGLGDCMGFDTMVNFNLPYFARNPQDFWQRWHISLSNWLRDYLYYPIALSKRGWGKWSPVFALMVTFTLCGLWHGAAWTFVIWGAYQGALLAIHKLIVPSNAKNRSSPSALIGRFSHVLSVLFVFNLVCLGWIIFRAASIDSALSIISSIFMDFKLTPAIFEPLKSLLFYTLPLIAIEVAQFRKGGDIVFIREFKSAYRTILYACLAYLLFVYGASSGKEFIYFQF